MQGTNAHVALEVSSERLAAPLFETQRQAWKRSRHWFLPFHHRLLKCFRLMASLGAAPEVLMHGGLHQSHQMSYLRELSLDGKSVLPAGVAIEVLFRALANDHFVVCFSSLQKYCRACFLLCGGAL